MKRSENKASTSKAKKEDTKPLWVKSTTGTLILRNPSRMRIKPGQEVSLTEKEIGMSMDHFELVKDGTGAFKTGGESTSEDVDSGTQESYLIEHAGGQYYNVLSPSGEKMNEKGLSAKKADKLKEQLEAPQ